MRGVFGKADFNPVLSANIAQRVSEVGKRIEIAPVNHNLKFIKVLKHQRVDILRAVIEEHKIGLAPEVMHGTDNLVIVQGAHNFVGRLNIIHRLPEFNALADQQLASEGRARFCDFKIGLNRCFIKIVLFVKVNFNMVCKSDCPEPDELGMFAHVHGGVMPVKGIIGMCVCINYFFVFQKLSPQ